jgi:peptidyl-prolyl cis-trans isomerase D
MVIFQVEGHSPASTKPLEQVRAQIIDDIKRERGSEAAYAAAEQAVADLGKGTSFAQVAARLKGKAQGPQFVGRESTELPAELRDALFAAARPGPDRAVRQAIHVADGAVALFEATNWRSQPLSDNAQIAQLRSDRELQRYTRRDIQAYMEDVMSSARIVKNPDAFEQF